MVFDVFSILLSDFDDEKITFISKENRKTKAVELFWNIFLFSESNEIILMMIVFTLWIKNKTSQVLKVKKTFEDKRSCNCLNQIKKINQFSIWVSSLLTE